MLPLDMAAAEAQTAARPYTRVPMYRHRRLQLDGHGGAFPDGQDIQSQLDQALLAAPGLPTIELTGQH